MEPRVTLPSREAPTTLARSAAGKSRATTLARSRIAATIIGALPGWSLSTLSRILVVFLSYWLPMRCPRGCKLRFRTRDPVAAAVTSGHTADTASGTAADTAPDTAADTTADTAPPAVWHDAQEVCAVAYAGGDMSRALRSLLALVQRFPNASSLQLLAAHVLDDLDDGKAAVAAWRGIVVRFPLSQPAFLGLVSALLRRSGRSAAIQAIRTRFPAGAAGFADMSVVAAARARIGDVTPATAAYRRLALSHPEHLEACRAAVGWLAAHGRHREAVELLKATLSATDWHCQRLRAIADTMARLPQAEPRDRLSARRSRSLTVLERVLDEVVSARRMLLPTPPSVPQSVVMVIGSLGAGGAERQLVKAACGLHALRLDDSGNAFFAQLKILAQSCRSRRNDGFFRAELNAAGIPVVEYEQLPLYGGKLATSAVRPVVRQLRFLPVSMVEAILRVSDALRVWRPDVVEIWQEATVFDTALAALLARVPRIILRLRTVPPIDRPEMFKPEYPILFRALAVADNVTFSCNSRFAAGRYADWLDIDVARIRVVPNGVEPPSPAGDDAALALYREFAARTADSSVTIGVVMRIDANKRPLLWVEVAAAILQRLPAARFIVVGDGTLRAVVTQWVTQRGIADRFLFVGISSDIGFWLAKMDLFMLLSKQEGLPNSLIEAQLSRVPVLVTAAGGAPEAVIPGITGLIVGSDPSVEEVATAALDLVTDPRRLRAMGEAGQRWAAESFSPARMLREQVAMLSGAPRLQGGRREERTKAGLTVAATLQARPASTRSTIVGAAPR